MAVSREMKAPDVEERFIRAFQAEWVVANNARMHVHVGWCVCENAQLSRFFQTSVTGNDRCLFCGKPLQMTPTLSYIGGGKWEQIGRNSSGEHTSRIVQIQDAPGA